MSARAAAALPLVLALGVCACSGEVRPEIVVGIDACNECNMVIDQPRHACGYVLDGEFVTFDAPICLLRSYETLRKQGATLPREIYLADYADAALRPAETMTCLLTRHVPSTMEGGVICFADAQVAESMRRHDDEILTDWIGFRTAQGEPDRVIEVSFDSTNMSPEIVEAAKNELVLWKATGSGLGQDLVVSVLGYPEAGEMTVPATGETVEFRLLALRPGSGFPVVRAEDGEPLGMLKVTGAHTADEEAL